jgi:membrane-bound lytic murein transglycosylase D
MQKMIIRVFILLLFAGNIIWAQENRPLRNTPPDPSLPITNPATLNTGSLPAANTLLTAQALEQPRTQHFIEHYSSPRGIANLNIVMERGSIYMPFIREEVTKRGLPPELIYLPIIESGFQITARSRVGAMGLWQFMMNSIAPYNMRVTDIIDERRDFVLSTRGALQKLEDEYRRLGCWKLTLAAYNAGMGTMTRAIRRTESNCYWEISGTNEIRAETINFVPRLLAVAYVMSQPRRFGVSVWHPNFEWVAIPLQRQVSLDIIADEAGIDRNLMRRLNAELTFGISPLDSNYQLKIPAEYKEKVMEVLEREDLKLIRYYYHIVRQGDTLWSMSRHYGVSINMIEQHNRGISRRYLRVGETVIIPAFNEISPPARQNVPQAAPSTHVVQRGETLWSISRRYGISTQALADANGMRLNDVLPAGRRLNIPIR